MHTKSRGIGYFLAVASIAFVLIIGGAGYGLLVGKYQIFPYQQLVSAKRLVTPLPDYETIGQPLTTSVAPLRKLVHDNLGSVPLVGWGGGLAAVGSAIIGVDSRGQFFRYRSGGRLDPLDLSLDSNDGAYRRYLASLTEEPSHLTEINKRFRTLDLAAIEEGRQVTLFASYNYWDSQNVGKTTRVARLILRNGLETVGSDASIHAGSWEVIYETSPFLEFSSDLISPFNSDRSGGRMVIDESRNALIVGFGDQFYDGVHYPDAPQNPSSSYGKIIQIDLETLQPEILSMGHRNPQGLMIDREGNYWETEHGPQGGDELNLLQEGLNYGWPLETYGTDYGSYVWPTNRSQGRHDVYQKPVFSWVPSIATSNLIQIVETPSQWDGDLVVSSLRTMSLFRVRVDGQQVRFVEPMLIGERTRDLIQMQDGTILLWTDAAHFVEIKVDADQTARKGRLPVPMTPSEIEAGLAVVVAACQQCHELRQSVSNTAFISLWGISGREIGSTTFPAYSTALRDRGGTWTDGALRSFLSAPSAFAPGSFMPDPGIKDPRTMEVLVEYLKRLR